MNFSLLETILLHKDSAFLLRSHLYRLCNSAKTLGFNCTSLESALNHLNISISHTHRDLDILGSLRLLAQSSLPNVDIQNHVINAISHPMESAQDSVNGYYNPININIQKKPFISNCTSNFILHTNAKWRLNSNAKNSVHTAFSKDGEVLKPTQTRRDELRLHLWDSIEVLQILLRANSMSDKTIKSSIENHINNVQDCRNHASNNAIYDNVSHSNTTNNNQPNDTIRSNNINLESTNDFSLCRLLLAKDGTLTYNIQPLQPITNTKVRLAILKTVTSLNHHKTTMRSHFNKAMKSIAKNECFDYIYMNKDHKILEGSRSNIVVTKNGKHYTPKKALGLLAGTLRDAFIKHGICTERILYREDLYQADAIYCINSIRGIIPVTLD